MRRFFNKTNKYSAKRVEIDGHKFASKLEAAVYMKLKERQSRGEIEIRRLQARIKMTLADIVYIPDFECWDCQTQSLFYAEAKGQELPEWRLKLRLWRFYGPSRLEIWKGSYNHPKLVEIVEPKKD